MLISSVTTLSLSQIPCRKRLFFAPDKVLNIWKMRDSGDDGNRAGAKGVIKIGRWFADDARM